MGTRRRFKQSVSLKDRLAAWAKQVRVEADLLPLGPQRDELLAKARQADAACRLSDWVNSTGSQQPTR
jgi:hypothetical protein